MRLPFFAYGIASLGIVFTILGSSAEARAADEGPCGNFDFSGNISCRVDVQASCTAGCDAPKVVVACSGKCTATATQQCTGDCGTACIAECDPQALDCFAGCHAECDEPAIALCNDKHPGEDCVVQGRAQCDGHCKANCKVPDSSCQEHCTKCCAGSCQTQVNFDCDYGCMVEAEVNCKAQCTRPTGSIFCNGQYVNARDVEACIAHLATKLNVAVDLSARGSLSGGCASGNCEGSGKGSASASAGGCASAPGSSNGVAGVLAVVAMMAGGSLIRARRRRPR